MAKQQKSQFLPIRYQPIKGMSSDLHPLAPQAGTYGDALNLHFLTQLGSTTVALENILGNLFVFQLPTVNVQNQTVRFFFDISTTVNESFVLNIVDWNNNQLMFPFAFVSDHTASVATNLATFIFELGGALTTGGQTFTAMTGIVTGATTGYVDLTITTITARQWSVQYFYFECVLTGTGQSSLLTRGENFTSANGATGIVILNPSLNLMSVGSDIAIQAGDIITGDKSGNTFLVATSTVTTSSESNYYSIITEEAIDASLAGMLRYIGSYDLLGDGIIWSTPQTNLPTVVDVTGATNNGSGLIRISMTSTAGLVTGSAVTIQGVTGTTEANGTWIINFVGSQTVIDLQGSTFVNAYTGGGEVNINTGGVGEIGVATLDNNTLLWTYTTLLRSREFNFNTQKQVKTVCERSSYSANIYWTDNYNPYRRFYYQGAYQTNGALNYIDPSNEYFYGDIDLATRLFSQNGLAEIDYSAQLQSGGNLPPGNYRYIVQFLDEDFNPTLWTDPSGIFVVYENPDSPNTQAIAEQVYGNDTVTVPFTSKINQMLITGIVPNLFKYIQLGALFYVDGTTVPIATIVNRILLAQTPTQIIQHTGNETNVQTLDINTLVLTQPDIARGLGIDIVANRMIPSNTTGSSDIDFTAWVQSFNYNLQMDSISGVGAPPETGGTPYSLQVGEYEDSKNTFNNMGFMLNEKYRIAPKFELQNGAITENFWFADPRFNMTILDAPKQTGALPFMDLTDSTAANVYVPTLQITNINWNFLINGVPAYSLVKKIHWEMVEMTEQFREVIASGAVAMGCSMNADPNVAGTFGIEISSTQLCTSAFQYSLYNNSNRSIQDIADYMFMEGAYIKVANPEYTYQNQSFDRSTGLTVERQYMSFYALDCLLNQASIIGEGGDEIIVFGAPKINIGTSVGTAANTLWPYILPAFKDFTGYVDSAMYPNTSYSVLQVQNIGAGQEAGFITLSGRNYSKALVCYVLDLSTPTTANFTMFNTASPVLNTNGNVVAGNLSGGFTDYGFYMAQYFRAKTNKFGDTSTSKYIPTGAITEYLSTSQTVYGDTFNQKSWVKHKTPAGSEVGVGGHSANTCGGDPVLLSGFGGGVAFYSQNRSNSQMISRGDSSLFWKYPSIPFATWLYSGILASMAVPNTPTYTTYNEDAVILFYNSGYNSQQGVTNDVAFDPNLPNNPSTPARWWWSQEKPENSVQDLYTIILPLNFRDEDLTNGAIWHTIVANQEFFTIQERNLIRQYVDDTSMIQSSEATIVMGSSGVGSQRGISLSGYGTIHGFGVIKGKSPAGKDTFYWLDTYQGKCMRYEPSDGDKCLSDTHNMRWFFNNYLQPFVNEALTPANGQGICGVWDDQNSEAIWTVRAKKQVGTFNPLAVYFKGSEVSYVPSTLCGVGANTGLLTPNEPFQSSNGVTGNIGNYTDNTDTFITVYNLSKPIQVMDGITGLTSGNTFVVTSVTPPDFSTFEQTGEIYISLANSNLGNPPDLFPNLWQLVPHFGQTQLSNGLYPYNYYNEYSIAYNEVKDKFVTRYSWLPKLYIKIGKDFIMPRPVENENKAYIAYAQTADYGTFFTDSMAVTSPVSEIVQSFISGMICNYDPNLAKRAMSIEIMTQNVPFYMTFTTKNYTTFLQQSDFQSRYDFFISAIKNNLLNGVNSGDTSRIYGNYISVSLTFDATTYQNFYNLILKCKIQNRIYKY